MTNTINPEVLRAAEQFTDGPLTPEILQKVAAMRGLPLYAGKRPVAPYTSVLVTETADELRQRLLFAQSAAAVDKARYLKDPVGNKRACERSAAQVKFLSEKLARVEAGDVEAGPTIDQLMTYTGLAGEIVQTAMLLRAGGADPLTQQAAFHKLASIARNVARKETTLREIDDSTEAAMAILDQFDREAS